MMEWAQCLEYVKLLLTLIVDKSAVDLVEKCHHCKGVEAHSLHNKLIRRLAIYISVWSCDKVVALLKENEVAKVHKEDHHQ